MIPTLGIDIGRVIISAQDAAGHDTSFLGGSDEDALSTPPSRGAIESIAELARLFERRVWLVSKAGPRIQSRTRAWLLHQRFFAGTGLLDDHLRFCRERSEKARICARLGITHFVDDRQDVLAHMQGIVPHLYLFGPQRHPPAAWTVQVEDWAETERSIARDFTEETDLIAAIRATPDTPAGPGRRATRPRQSERRHGRPPPDRERGSAE